MKLFLRRADTLDLITRRFGSVAEFARAWAAADEKTAKDRTSIYRYLDKGISSATMAIYEMCGELDVDPVALLDLERGKMLSDFERLRLSFYYGGPAIKKLKPLVPMFMPGPEWPSDEIPIKYYGRPWCVSRFTHDAKGETGKYALVKINKSSEVEDYVPLAFHFAYRRLGATDRSWRPYGSLIHLAPTTTLISEAGDFQQAQESLVGSVHAETHFGDGPAEFKLVSLHEFRVEIEFPSRAEMTVRFEA